MFLNHPVFPSVTSINVCVKRQVMCDSADLDSRCKRPRPPEGHCGHVTKADQSQWAWGQTDCQRRSWNSWDYHETWHHCRVDTTFPARQHNSTQSQFCLIRRWLTRLLDLNKTTKLSRDQQRQDSYELETVMSVTDKTNNKMSHHSNELVNQKHISIHRQSTDQKPSLCRNIRAVGHGKQRLVTIFTILHHFKGSIKRG